MQGKYNIKKILINFSILLALIFIPLITLTSSINKNIPSGKNDLVSVDSNGNLEYQNEMMDINTGKIVVLNLSDKNGQATIKIKDTDPRNYFIVLKQLINGEWKQIDISYKIEWEKYTSSFGWTFYIRKFPYLIPSKKIRIEFWRGDHMSSPDKKLLQRIERIAINSPIFNISNSKFDGRNVSFDWAYHNKYEFLKLKWIKVRYYLYNPNTKEHSLYNEEMIREPSWENSTSVVGRVDKQVDGRHSKIEVDVRYGDFEEDVLSFVIPSRLEFSPAQIVEFSPERITQTTIDFTFNIKDETEYINTRFKFYFEAKEIGSSDVAVKFNIKDSPDLMDPNSKDPFGYWIDKFVPAADGEEFSTGKFRIKNLHPNTEYLIKLFPTGRKPYAVPSNTLVESAIVSTSEEKFPDTNLFLEKIDYEKPDSLNDKHKYTFYSDLIISNDPRILDPDSIDIRVYAISPSEFPEEEILLFTPEVKMIKFDNNEFYEIVSMSVLDENILEELDVRNIRFEIHGKFTNGDILFDEHTLPLEINGNDDIYNIESDMFISEDLIVINDSINFDSNILEFNHFSHTLHETNSGTSLDSEIINVESSLNYLNSEFSNLNFQTSFDIEEFDFPENQKEFDFVSELKYSFKIEGIDEEFEGSNYEPFINEEIIIVPPTNDSKNPRLLIPAILVPIVFLGSLFTIYYISVRRT